MWAVSIIAYEMLTGRHPLRHAVGFGYAGHSDDSPDGPPRWPSRASADDRSVLPACAFWDGIHPTRAAHTIVAQAAASVLGL